MCEHVNTGDFAACRGHVRVTRSVIAQRLAKRCWLSRAVALVSRTNEGDAAIRQRAVGHDGPEKGKKATPSVIIWALVQ